MEDWIDLISVDEVSDGGMVGMKAGGHLYLVARVGDTIHVSDGRCPHLHGNLTKGTLEGTVVTCPLHRSQFDLVDGSVVRWTNLHGAALTVASAVRGPRPLTVYEVDVADGRVRVGPPRMAEGSRGAERD